MGQFMVGKGGWGSLWYLGGGWYGFGAESKRWLEMHGNQGASTKWRVWTLPGGRQLGVGAGEGQGLKGCCGEVRFLLLRPVCSTDSVPCTLLPCPSINLNTPHAPRRLPYPALPARFSHFNSLHPHLAGSLLSTSTVLLPRAS